MIERGINMSVKKILVLAAAGIASVGVTAAMAGGPDMAPAPVSHSGFYVEGQLGYARTNYRDYYTVTTPSSVTWKDGRGAFAFGGAVGYSWNKNIAAEVGAYYLGEAKIRNAAATANNAEIRRFAVYAAAKLTAPIVDNFDVFAKLGLAVVNSRLTINGSGVTGITPIPGTASMTRNYLRPVLGAGAQYHFNNNLYAIVQYLHIAGNGSMGGMMLQSNLFTGGVGYEFAA